MYITFRALITAIFGFFGLGLITKRELFRIREDSYQLSNLVNKLSYYRELECNYRDVEMSHDLLFASKSENGQDFFALWACNFKNNGTFLEIGAYDGITYSNSYLLEKYFGWQGLLVEPIPRNFAKIKSQRDCLSVQAAVVGTDKDKVYIVELPASNLSSMKKDRRDIFACVRNREHKVPGRSISSLARDFQLGNHIDFLSIDTEGMELEVLSTVDFSEIQIRAICVEHNFSLDSERLKNLLESHGYVQVFPQYSGNDFWFIKG